MSKPVPVVAIDVEGVRVLINRGDFVEGEHVRWQDEPQGDASAAGEGGASAAPKKRGPGRPPKVKPATPAASDPVDPPDGNGAAGEGGEGDAE